MGNTFTDGNGREWTPSITLGALTGFARETGLTLEALQDLGRIKLEYISSAIWHSVAVEAGIRKVSRDEFEASIGIGAIAEAGRIVMASVEAEFPEAAEEVEAEAPEVPLG